MKSMLLTVFVVLTATMSWSQESEKKSTMKLYKIESPGQTAQEELKQCKDLLEALDVKEAWLRSNPDELKKAEEVGWFEDAAETRAKLQARIKELEGN